MLVSPDAAPANLSVELAVVVGSPRSGTTFLMSVLDTLPSVESVSGNLLPVGVAHLAAQELSDELQEGLQRSFRCALGDYLESGLYRSRSAALRKWWAASRRPSQLPSALRGARAERMLAYKEPFLSFAPEFALRSLPNVRLLHIYRDGRDVADSLVRSYDVLSDVKLATLDTSEVQLGRRTRDLYVPWWVRDSEIASFLGASPYVRAIWMWRFMVLRWDEFLVHPEARSGRVLSIRYEDLVEDPIGQGEAIARHLDLRLTRRARQRLRSAHPRSIGAYRRRPTAEVRAAEQVAGSQLESLGYRLTTGAAREELHTS